jgi:8-oxo-dGTP pyrophosphatase MutT (NUDIX family)
MSGRVAFTAAELHAYLTGKSFTAGATGAPGNVSGLTPFNLAGQAKRPKESVGYRKAGDLSRSCGECSMFIAGGACTGVEGLIKPADTCDIWTPRTAKAAKAPYVAGLMVRAADTGRVLMLQRALDDDQDHAAGKWEPPGGHIEAGETLAQGAQREWSEEVGLSAPTGTLTGSWMSEDGIYQGFVLEIPSEDALDLEHRDEVANPDGDTFEVAAWWDPATFAGNDALRPEMHRDLPAVMQALGAAVAKAQRGNAETLREYWTHEAHPGPTHFALEEPIRWGEPGDWYRCTSQVEPYLGAEGAKGYCNLLHHRALGYWPAQHARMERGK